MTKALKMISAAALVAASATAALAQDVPLNTTVAGGQGNERVDGQVNGGEIIITATATAAILTAVVLIGSSSDTATTTPNP